MQVYISGSFDSTRGETIRFFQEAARLGDVTLFLQDDETLMRETGDKPRFSLSERLYFTESVRYIDRVIVPENWTSESLPAEALALAAELSSHGATGKAGGVNTLWFVREAEHSLLKQAAAEKAGIGYRICRSSDLEGYPEYPELADRGRIEARAPKKVLVTGCYDLFHTGHVRFFEEVADYGELYVVIGSDKNVALLKGPDRPLFKQDERLLIIDAIKFVKQSLVSTGSGWMDAAPEIAAVKPDIYAVNEDGDKPEKREFCSDHDLQYLILKRKPKEGLPARSSTQLRGE